MPTFSPSRPEKTEYGPSFETYIGKVSYDDVLAGLVTQTADTMGLLNSISEERALFRYAPEKWSVKEVMLHLSDAERIFSYRALRIARGDQTPLAKFDENEFAKMCGADERSWESLKEEYASVRQSTMTLFRSFDSAAWMRIGTASDRAISVRALAYITAGHELHHLDILRSRYLQ